MRPRLTRSQLLNPRSVNFFPSPTFGRRVVRLTRWNLELFQFVQFSRLIHSGFEPLIAGLTRLIGTLVRMGQEVVPQWRIG